MFADTIFVESGTRAQYGVFVPTGATQTVPARVIGKVRAVADETGRQRLSTVQATLAGVFNVSVGDRFTLPPRFQPNQPPAIAVDHLTDENGPHHEVVYFQ